MIAALLILVVCGWFLWIGLSGGVTKSITKDVLDEKDKRR